MRKPAILLLLCCLLPLLPVAQAATFVDSAGRRVQLPPSPARIFAAGPPASVFLYGPKPQALLVYLARTADGLETGLQGSINRELIERAGGSNIMQASDGRRGLARVSLESVYLANPDTIITWDRDFYGAVWRDPRWQAVDAVFRKRVHLAPVLPFGWIDRPPSLNRIIGLKWLLGLLHPKVANLDLEQQVRNFYRLYYGVDLDEQALSALLPPAAVPPLPPALR